MKNRSAKSHAWENPFTYLTGGSKVGKFEQHFGNFIKFMIFDAVHCVVFIVYYSEAGNHWNYYILNYEWHSHSLN